MKLILAAAAACTLFLVSTGCDRNDSRRGTYEAPGVMERQDMPNTGQQPADHPEHHGSNSMGNQPGEARDTGTEPSNQNFDRDDQLTPERGNSDQAPSATQENPGS